MSDMDFEKIATDDRFPAVSANKFDTGDLIQRNLNVALGPEHHEMEHFFGQDQASVSTQLGTAPRLQSEEICAKIFRDDTVSGIEDFLHAKSQHGFNALVKQSEENHDEYGQQAGDDECRPGKPWHGEYS